MRSGEREDTDEGGEDFWRGKRLVRCFGGAGEEVVISIPVWPFAAAMCRGPLLVYVSFAASRRSLSVVCSRLQRSSERVMNSCRSPARA